MDRNGALAAVLLILVVAGASGAGEGKGDDKPNSQKVSPSPTPNPLPKADPPPSSSKPAPKKEKPPVDAGKSNGTDKKAQPELGTPASVPPPPLSGTETKAPQGPNVGNNDKKDDNKTKTPQGPNAGNNDKKDDNPTKTPQGPKAGNNDKKDNNSKGGDSSTGNGSTTDTNQQVACSAESEKCQVTDLVACLKHSTDESKELFLVVKNGGEDDLTVNITTSIPITTSKPIDVKLQVAKHSSDEISVSTNVTNVIKVVLNAGKGDCILHIRPSISDWNPFQQFPAYATQLTPIHGAYVLFFFIIIVGGTWACCKFGRKARRGDSGVPYQQLEMGTLPQSTSFVGDTNTADGWDQSWDDDWDEEEAAARPAEKHHTGNVSSNGLTSRPPNKDGWDVDWDD